MKAGCRVALMAVGLAGEALAEARPNILLLMADDWGWPASPLYGDTVVKTPALEQIARDGVLFTHAYCSAPSCAPSRGAVLTGQDFWRLGEGANLLGTLPAKLPVYPELLEKSGYVIGSRSKGWSPGNLKAGGRTENPVGPRVGKGDFAGFLKTLPPDKPFCFWFGSTDPHRPYKEGSGVASGMDPAAVRVPGFLPDTPVTRSDLCDYYLMVQKFNDDALRALKALEASGRYDNTLIVITGDNGFPFPHGKTQIFEWGVHQPLAICWKGRVPRGRTVEDYVSFTDFAPTFLEAAGVVVPGEMTGKSLLPLLVSGKSGLVEPGRDAVFVGLERHVGSYPMRAVRTREFAYIRNFEPTRDLTFYGQGKSGPTAAYLMTHKDDSAAMKRLYEASYGPRPAEQLFDLRSDPGELVNVADEPKYAEVKQRLSERLMARLKQTGDPRALGHGEVFDNARTWANGDKELPAVGHAAPGGGVAGE